MKLNMTLKQRKYPRHITDLASALEGFGKIDNVEMIDNPQSPFNFKMSGNFNISEVYQKITSSGYSILSSSVKQDSKIKQDSQSNQDCKIKQGTEN